MTRTIHKVSFTLHQVVQLSLWVRCRTPYSQKHIHTWEESGSQLGEFWPAVPWVNGRELSAPISSSRRGR